MTKFFLGGTIHSVESYAGAVKLPKKVADLGERVHEEKESPPFKLRRQKAIYGFDEFFNMSRFFSVDSKHVHCGKYDLKHESNADLRIIQSEIDYR